LVSVIINRWSLHIGHMLEGSGSCGGGADSIIKKLLYNISVKIFYIYSMC
jgi:hypothetical protein